MRAGDVIKHIPSGETWGVAATQGNELVCCGWPESIAPMSDCELVKACTDEEHIAMLKSVVNSCGDQLRGSWARYELEKMK